MLIKVPYGPKYIDLFLPDDTTIYRTSYPEPETRARELVLKSIRNPVGCPSLAEKIRASGARSVVVVVPDITRPIPYEDFLDVLLAEIEKAGVARGDFTILIATGMHRPSTVAEREYMFGAEVCAKYRVIDHRAEKRDDLVMISGISRSGRAIELNRHYVEADFRLITGLVEPHFMAGFSGGRKAVCPGLCSLKTIKAFHSYEFLNNPRAGNGILEGNPLQEEALSIARQAKVDFCLNLVVARDRRLVRAVAGELEASHTMACGLVSQYACPPVVEEKDVVITSSGGYPLDATFYQCIKGMVAGLPSVKRGGAVVSLGSCSEGIGGSEYRDLMFEYAGRWRDFLRHIEARQDIVKDQWEFQMQARVLEHVGDENLVFITHGLSASDLNRLSVKGIRVREGHLQAKAQELVDRFLARGRSLAVIPEGPYCAPLRGVGQV